MENDFKAQALMFKALADEKRLAILNELKSGEKCACYFIDNFGMGQSAVSYHMKILCDCGIVESRQEWKWTYYRLNSEGGKRLIQLVEELTTQITED